MSNTQRRPPSSPSPRDRSVPAGGAPSGGAPQRGSQSSGTPTGKGSGQGRAAKAAAAREAARVQRHRARQRAQRRRLLLTVGAPVLVVLLVVTGFLIVRANRSPATATTVPTSPTTSAGTGAALAAAVKNIPAAAFDAVGTGTNVHPLAAVTGSPLTAAGKPRVLYIGAQYCPFCAGERWAVTAALSRFGSFDNLGVTTSSSSDSYPSTATLSFHGATYTSSLLSFTGIEKASNAVDPATGSYAVLDPVPPADQQIDATYNPQGSIPFVDFGNRYTAIGASFDVGILQGLTQAQIAAQLADPSTPIARQVLGAANQMTAALCVLTGNQPAAVCTSSAVTAQKLP